MSASSAFAVGGSANAGKIEVFQQSILFLVAVVIGGTNVFGGSGSVLGVVLGCLLLGTINVALAVLGIAATWQLAVYGFVILLAVVVDAIIQRELRRVTMERDILKKALGYFAKDPQ